MDEKRVLLANDIDGDPFEVPPEAVAWRVRRRSGKQGRPQSVFDAETGTPLEIELDSGIDELRPYGPGGYRLDGIDGNSKMIPGVTAYVEVPADEVKPTTAETPTETVATLREVTALLRESMLTHCRAVEAMAKAFGPVRPATQEKPVYMMPPAASPAVVEEKPTDPMAKLMEWLPMIQGVIQMAAPIIQSFSGNSASSTAAAAASAVADAAGAAAAGVAS